MAMMVHLTDQFTAEKIIRSGIKGAKWRLDWKSGIRARAVFCMPVLQDFYISHQWLRELKRVTTKKVVGVYFRIPDTEIVQCGKYDEAKRLLPVNLAIRQLLNRSDPMGYEMILLRSVAPDEIHRIRPLPQTIGWRYRPDSHHQIWICECDTCLRGRINAQRRRVFLQRNREQLSRKRAAKKYA